MQPIPHNFERESFQGLVYTPLDEAVALLQSRKSEVNINRIGVPDLLLKGNCAVLFRFLASPNYEVLRFIELALGRGLSPIIIEYHCDKFVSRNMNKYGLAKMGFYWGQGRNGGRKIDWVKIVDFHDADGARFADISTLWNEPLINFHRRLLFEELPGLTPANVFDASDWFRGSGAVPRLYYEAFFSLMISNAILFETYLFDSLEASFTREVVLPAFCAVKERFGIKPLITPLDPLGQEGDEYWTLYPPHLKHHTQKSGGTSIKLGQI